MKKILLALIICLLPTLAFAAEQTQITKPYPTPGICNTTTCNGDNQSSTVAVTNTFQQIFAASTNTTGRVSCTIQNTGTNSMYVYFGATADATIAKSVKLIAGQATSCDTNDIVIKTAVQITGTATETYYASQW